MTDHDTTMTIGQLRKRLADFPDDVPVHFAVPMLDYIGTVVARAVTKVDELATDYSVYFQETRIASENAIRDEDDTTYVVVIS